MVDFSKVKIIKELGAGMFGTTYLASYNNQEYALKIQKILPKNRKKDFKNEMWRELDLYNYINKLPAEKSKFFTKLIGYEIYKNCKHKQKRPFKPRGPFAKTLAKIDNSDWCVKYLTEYKGQTTLHNFLTENKLTNKQTYAIMLQICKIILTLYAAGYSHNDLHPGNIMINPTAEKYFSFNGKKIPFHGYQITAIDYGEVLHKKFKIKMNKNDRRHDFISNKKQWLFAELYWDCYNVFINFPYMIDACKKNKQKLPWERKGNIYEKATKMMVKNHPAFYKKMLHKYLRLFPKAKHFNFEKLDFQKIEKHKNAIYIWTVLNRIVDEFSLAHPETFKKYWRWCDSQKFMLPKSDIQKILTITTSTKLVKYFITKITA